MKCCPIFSANLPMLIHFWACLQKPFSCEFHECRRSKGTSLRNVNEFLSLLFTFICHLVKFGIRELHIMMLSFCVFCENHRGESCTYMYVIWKVEYALVWSIPFATLYLLKTSKNSHPVHPNELDLFRQLDSPWCPHILKSFEGRLHFWE